MEQGHEQGSTPKKTKKIRGADWTSYKTLFWGTVLLPIFFLPIFNLPVDITKGAFFFTLTIAAFLLWLVARMKSGRFVFPKSVLLGSVMALPVAFLVSALFSEVPMVSLLGVEYETGTFFSILVLSLAVFLSSIFFQTKERVFSLYGWLVGVSFVVLAFLICGFLIAGGILPSFFSAYIPLNVVGKWNDLAVFLGFTSIISLITLELMTLTKKLKITAVTSLVLSLIILTLINFSLLWIIVGAFALLVFVYAISFVQKDAGEEITERKIPLFSFSVLLLSVFFVLAGGPVNDLVRNTLRLNIPQEVVRPSWYATGGVVKETLLKDPIFGVGPNRFLNAWTSYKPAGINTTNAWDVDFNNGIGVVPTFASTLGLVGIIAWLAFLGLFLYAGFKAVFKVGLDKTSHYIVASSFLGALYLWVIAVFYVPNIAIFGLAFIMTGVFIAALVEGGIAKNYDFSFLEDPRVGFVSVLVLILFIISSIVGGYFVVEKFLSLASYQKGMMLSSRGDVLGARAAIENAKKHRESDLYYRALSEMDINSLGVILNQKGVSQETVKAQFQLTSREAIDNAIKATQFDKTNYINWVYLARAYESLIPFGAAADFYESSKKNFEEAIAWNHNNPSLYLELARLELLNKNVAQAKEYIAKALTMKNDYVDAIFHLAQIQADEGDLKNAIISTEAASLVSPNNIGVFFQLGFLRYKNGDYAGAVSALERAVELNPSYSNAKYFLGLSYSKLGRVADAIRQFEDVKSMNPDNTEVQSILNNLRASGSAFSGGVPAAPEKSATPPIKEKKK